MNRYVVEISALIYVECVHDEETLSEIISHPLPGNYDEPPHQRDGACIT